MNELRDFAGALKILIYHGGQLLGAGGNIYSSSKVDGVGNIDLDFISVMEIGYAVKGLGYILTGDI